MLIFLGFSMIAVFMYLILAKRLKRWARVIVGENSAETERGHNQGLP